jgi:hypothetical protein
MWFLNGTHCVQIDRVSVGPRVEFDRGYVYINRGNGSDVAVFQRSGQTCPAALPIRLTQIPLTYRDLTLSRVKSAEGRCPDVVRDTRGRAEGVERVEPPVGLIGS